MFAVGDPMQSIYFFRDADAELFPRVKKLGLEIPNAEPFLLDFVRLSANFRTTPSLVRRLNKDFESIFAEDDGSGVSFSPASPAREKQEDGAFFELHLRFAHNAAAFDEGGDDAGAEQLRELVKLIREYQPAMNKAHAGGEKFRVAVLARSRNSLAPIADALHEAGIRFRAVDLEKLAQRQEVLDALALARALLNPQDRLAWLGVLRAPWCGLGLEDLHALAGGDDALVARPVPDLLRERQSLLSDAGRAAARRMMDTLDGLAALGGRHPIATLGTWLQQVWARLGGDDCYDATARGNLALLWNCLDRLAAGPEDLLGPALEAALEDLTALPDPHASIECGVQLMTIHKSKGLEFEVVIVPDLQAKSAASKPKLLSWLERGLPPDADNGGRDDADGITEFLIAPLSLKGSEKGRSKAWVDHEYNQREAQEMRRILYVAATRAREELHLFARPGCKVDASGEWILAGRAGLLSTAWPALKEEVEARFAAWKSTLSAMRDSASGQVVEILTLAASAEGGPFLLPSTKAAATAKPTRLRRLPVGYPRLDGSGGAGATSAGRTGSGGFEGGISFSDGVGMRLFDRLQGGVRARAMGTAVHALLEELARLRSLHEWDAARAEVRACEPRIAAQIRSLGIPLKHAEELSGRALRIALAASRDAAGAWILSPHPQAASEVRWSGVMGGGLQSVQADRVFRAGLTPGSGGDEAWWIVDYKTHAEGAGFEAAGYLASLRKAYAAQLEMYAAVLRNLHGEDARIRAAIYYPSMLLLDWWEV